jgi:predicted acylesterase/phospholipase RssA
MREFDMVFEGGGAKGVVFVGALKALDSKFTPTGWKPRRLVGTSAGAISATLLGAGYSADEILEITQEKLPDGKSVFTTFFDVPATSSFIMLKDANLTASLLKSIKIPFVGRWIANRAMPRLMGMPYYRTIFSLVELGGLFKGDAFLAWIKDKLFKKNCDTTFKDFPADLTLVATDADNEARLVLNRRTAPDCPVADAVRMSMSIPFVWQAVRWQAGWGKYRDGKDSCVEDIQLAPLASLGTGGHAIVDGGVLSNFALDLLTSNDPENLALMGSIDPSAVLGLLIDETLDVTATPPAQTNTGFGVLTSEVLKVPVVRRLMAIVDAMMTSHDRLTIAQYTNQVCRLPAKDYSTLEFDMSPDRMNRLIQAGQNAMLNHLNKVSVVDGSHGA